jgi:hypothetical protein
MASDRRDEDLLRGATAWQRKMSPAATPMGRSVQDYLAGANRTLRSAGQVLDVWDQLVPTTLREHCTPVALERGRLRVEVDPGPYMHELQLAATELVMALKTRCPRVRLDKIILRVRGKQHDEV